MFKRVDKRRRKKEEEEKLGLDEEVKEILGIQDTDSEESESELDSDNGVEEDEDRNIVLDEDGEMDSGEDEDDEGEDPSITVSQALKDPLYIVSILPDVKACIVCPGKLLKSVKMVQLHRTSNAHIRRFKQFSNGSADAKPNDSAWEILKRNSETKPKLSLTTSGASKRAEKKRTSQALRKTRREEAKKKAKAKKAIVTSENTTAPPLDTPGLTKSKPPLKKKRKVRIEHQALPPARELAPTTPPPVTKKRNKQKSAVSHSKPASPTIEGGDHDDARPPLKVQDSVKIQDIVKSTSNRAKTARLRALTMSQEHKSSN